VIEASEGLRNGRTGLPVDRTRRGELVSRVDGKHDPI
jgi:hypothetical protein